jgi:hypothetical protein
MPSRFAPGGFLFANATMNLQKEMVPTEGGEAKLEAFVTLRKCASRRHKHTRFCTFAE